MILAYIDTGDLLEVIVVSLVAGIGCTAAFGLAILGGTHAIDFGREGRAAAATVYGALGILAMAVVLAAIAVGIVALVDK